MSEILTTDEIENMTERLAWTGEHRQEADAYVAIVASHEALRAENAELKAALTEASAVLSLLANINAQRAGNEVTCKLYFWDRKGVPPTLICECPPSDFSKFDEVSTRVNALLDDTPDGGEG